MKTLIKVFFILFLFNALLVYMHYQDASDVFAKSSEKTSYDQEIEITNRVDALYIRHHFTNLPENRLEINWPKASEQRTCNVEDSESCLRLNEELTAFVEGEEEAQSISYVIPKSNDVGDVELLQSVIAELHGVAPGATVLHMIDEVHADGMWITGLQQVGHKKMARTEYTLFSGRGRIQDLYWQQYQKAIQYSSDQLTVYGNNLVERIDQFESVLSQLGAPHMALVLNDNDQAISKNRFSITKEDRLDPVLNQFAISQYYVNYQADTLDAFTAEVVTALLLKEETELAKEAMHELENTLSPFQIDQLSLELKGKYGMQMSAEIMDELIEEVIGYQTSFFEENRQRGDGFFPLILEMPQKIVVSELGTVDKNAIMQNDKMYFPVKEIMEKIGYNISRNDQSLYIENAEHQYRFPIEGNFYVFNDRRFNTQSAPFKQIEGEFYFEKSAMLRIFRLLLEETTEEMIIQSIDMPKEGVN